MKTVLITGASGFIGRHAIPHLIDAGYQVHGVDLKAGKTPDVVMHPVDLFEPAAVLDLFASLRPSHLLHLAWYVEPGKFWTSPQNLRWVQASLEILRCFADHGGQRCVSAGTCAEYSWHSSQPCSEDHSILEPATLYGSCKNALRLLQSKWAAQAGFTSAWGRIFHLYGPFEPAERLVPGIIRALLAGEPARCTLGEQLRDFMHVDDVARAFVHLLDSDFNGPVNIASGSPTKIAEIARMLSTQISRPDLLQLGALPTPTGDPPVLVADVAKLTALGFSPKYSLETGLADSIAWWDRARLADEPKARV